MTVILLRHGRSTSNTAYTLAGRTDGGSDAGDVSDGGDAGDVSQPGGSAQSEPR